MSWAAPQGVADGAAHLLAEAMSADLGRSVTKLGR